MKNNKIIKNISSTFLFLRKHKVFTIILLFLLTYVVLIISSNIFGAEQVGNSIEKSINYIFDNKIVHWIIGVPVFIFAMFNMFAGMGSSAASMDSEDKKEFEKWKTIRQLYK